MRPAAVLCVSSDASPIRDPGLRSRHPSPPPSHVLLVGSLTLNWREGLRGDPGPLSSPTSEVQTWTGIYLKPGRGLVVKTRAARRRLCSLLPLPRSPTAITQTPSTTVPPPGAFVFLKPNALRSSWGGGRGGGNSIRFVATKFFKKFLETIAFKKQQQKTHNYFRHKKYLYKYYLLVSCYSSFGCKL